MLGFITAQSVLPWESVFQNFITEIPPGKTYIQDLVDMVPRSVKPTEFLLFTDRYTDPLNPSGDQGVKVSIYVNGTLVKDLIPNSSLVRIKMHLAPPPATNFITVSNGIDENVNMSVVASHQSTHMAAMAQENFGFLWNTIEKYFSAIRSPWATFFVEYQLPWKELLPDIQELKILSIKMLANSLYGEAGLAGAVPEVISAFTVNTPAIVSSYNRDPFQPDIFQPVFSGDDVAGFEAHTWFANVCLNHWVAFSTLMNNCPAYSIKSGSEQSVIVNKIGTEWFEQHLFDSVGPRCSVNGLIDVLGCMDSITACVATQLTSWPTICFFANPFDKSVVLPGIGGGYFDSPYNFDGPHGPFDSIYDIDQLTDYWVGASTSKHFDMGMCLDTYNVGVQTPHNTDCCSLGPTTKLFTTTVCTDSVTSAVTPAHPVFGGGDGGLLSNPYFSSIFV